MIALIQEFLSAWSFLLCIPAVPLGLYRCWAMYPYLRVLPEKTWQGTLGATIVAAAICVRQAYVLYASDAGVYTSVNWPWPIGIGYRVLEVGGVLLFAWSMVNGRPGPRFWRAYVVTTLILAAVWAHYS